MSKRNIILFTIVLLIITIGAFVFLYFYKPTNQGGVVTESINFLSDFLPFGNNKNTNTGDTTQPVDVSGYIPTSEGDIQNSILKKVSSFPIAGYGIFTKERFKNIVDPNPTPTDTGEEKTNIEKVETTPISPPTEFLPALRYVNKFTGNIYQTFADRIDERKFSSTMIPKVYDAFFGNNGESIMMRYFKKDNKTVETFMGTLPKEYLGADSIGMNEINGSFLPENVSDISISPNTEKIFYLFNVENNIIGIIQSLQSDTKIQAFDSSFTEWLSFWPNEKIITVTTKPSYNVPGYMYKIDTEKKDFDKILGGINGLTTLTSPNGEIVLYGDNNLSLSVFNISTGDYNMIGLKTLPEKCTWGSKSDTIYCAVPKYIDNLTYPDSWYQGEVSFSDEIWKINIQSGVTTKIIDPLSVEDGEEIDGIKLGLDKDENFLFFINKKDSYLWELQSK
ncbi:MAG: hypothetical protein UR25_C0003G0154 [Candidatus Nomurabacteria bacterium GW2011_GWE1_32_28]|uniref:Uncharacterized protein n=1 Tax=Candidatus Nomurabacteria bacterium GW2011_GWF1_31_48 TaxID=1618767 RepID=A0A0F9YV79_9BACT|nr:MAG: hypothetical protein UR10_C0003G0153 [Candidatus Nomurabacteria bacterium GW2011_GWF2_30_133]KKP28793.1 MAG: hypothetical protein UR18_C0002G0205 [Candidatus Nomurabacteria bacterium GW2011_GWE2_31_40]KKP30371.1 MAG: hypothetical protein UR19_C0003G0207 [Candidatus Nomurabacteria bacterium GW2011_GWF1_31_48]KKP34898.1 MAG: hypothetical protein UR25_C0003G0154 [Candidatus Nomurabacteria bacterium GW2011_GWE1_32_28]HAS80990.1 hypothetical protein [Candidatus Nomurabacteria bacterium]